MDTSPILNIVSLMRSPSACFLYLLDIITRTSEWVITLWRSCELFLHRDISRVRRTSEISLPKTMNMISTDDHHLQNIWRMVVRHTEYNYNKLYNSITNKILFRKCCILPDNINTYHEKPLDSISSKIPWQITFLFGIFTIVIFL